MTKKTVSADNYIKSNLHKVNQKYKHTYHLSNPIGWMNDPNGFIYAFKEYHLFYQFNPYAEHWGPMHWAHTKTFDFVKWEHLQVALAPDEPYDEDLGAFSGTAIFEDNQIKVFYTGVTKKDGEQERQQQCFAVSNDGINFTKYKNNPIIKTEQIPEGFNKIAFRDPKVFKSGNTYYCLLAAHDDKFKGQLLMYKSVDCIKWDFVAPAIDKEFDMHGALECPDYFEHSGQDIIICSPQSLKSIDGKHQNASSSIYMVGKLDKEQGKFRTDYYDDIDSGFDFYAPQTTSASGNRRILIAWMNMWGRNFPTADDGWVGAMTFPREVFLKNGRLFQLPAREIESYRRNEVLIHNTKIDNGQTVTFDDVCGDKIELLVEADISGCNRFGIKLFADAEYETLLYYDNQAAVATLDRTNSGIVMSSDGLEAEFKNLRKVQIQAPDNILKIRILLDVSSIEVFLQDGERALTANIYTKTFGKGVFFYSDGGHAIIKKLQKFDIKVE